MINASGSGPEDLVDETNDESFPASDPPAWSGAHAGLPARAVAPPSHTTLRHVRASTPVEETAARIERALTAAGMKIFARIDQAAEARAVALAMRPTILILFGSPQAGTPLMIARPTVAIDLPLKALVWQDEAGATWLTYNTPSLLEERHGLQASLASTLAPASALLERAVKS